MALKALGLDPRSTFRAFKGLKWSEKLKALAVPEYFVWKKLKHDYKKCKNDVEDGKHHARQAAECFDLEDPDKVNEERAMIGLPPLQSLNEKVFVGIMHQIKSCCYGIWCPCLKHKPNLEEEEFSYFHWYSWPLCQKGTYYNMLLRSCCAFVVGLLIPLPFLIILVYLFAIPITKTCFCMGLIGFILSLGMSLSKEFQCAAWIAVGTFITSKGRFLIFLWVCYLIYQGPITNVSNNCHILMKGWSCLQDLTHNATDYYLRSATQPLKDLLNVLDKTFQELTELGRKMRYAFMKVKDIFVEMIETFKTIYRWFTATREECNKRISAPFKRCWNIFTNGYDDCKSKGFAFMCKVVLLARYLCNIVYVLDILCIITDAVRKFVVHILGPIFSAIIDDLYMVFYFKLSYEHDFYYNVTMSKTFTELADEFYQELMYRLWFLSHYVTLGTVAVLALCLTVIVETAYYLYNFLIHDSFDNIYITKEFLEVDLRRRKQRKPTVLPLLDVEHVKYVSENSWRLTAGEKKGIRRRMVYWFFVSLGLLFFVLFDYCIYWVFNLISNAMKKFHIGDVLNKILKIHVEGNGILSDIYRAVVTRFDNVDKPSEENDANRCIPTFREPAWSKTRFIMIVIAAILVSCFFEPFILRIRHRFCLWYYPKKKKHRAINLYSRILRLRIPILRRQYDRLNDVYYNQKSYGAFEISCLDKLSAMSPTFTSFLEWLGYKRKFCLLCGTTAKDNDKNFIHCENYGCKGYYCGACYDELNNICPLCNRIILFEDEDVSVEQDSSEEEEMDLRPVVRLQSLHKRNKPKQHSEGANARKHQHLEPLMTDYPLTQSKTTNEAPLGVASIALPKGPVAPPSVRFPMQAGIRPPILPWDVPFRRMIPGIQSGLLPTPRLLPPGVRPRLLQPGINPRLVSPLPSGMRLRPLSEFNQRMMPPLHSGMNPFLLPQPSEQIRPMIFRPLLRPSQMFQAPSVRVPKPRLLVPDWPPMLISQRSPLQSGTMLHAPHQPRNILLLSPTTMMMPRPDDASALRPVMKFPDHLETDHFTPATLQSDQKTRPASPKSSDD